jgi:acyl-CoA synthetase (AMP-forming)/AMP-acid ligase II
VSTTRAPESLADLIRERAQSSPDSPFLEDARSDRTISYAALETAVAAWTALFDELAIPSGGAVLLTLRDPLSFAIVHLAAISSGRRSVPLNPDLADGEPGRTSELIGGAALIVTDVREPDAGLGPSWATVDPENGAPADILRSTVQARTPGELRDGGAAVLFTSGSTGTPKGVELHEKQLMFVARQVAENNQLALEDRGFNSLPLFHVNAEVVGVLSTLVAGATLVLDASFHRTGFWELLRDRRVTWLNAVPAILAVLTRDGATVPETGLRFIRSASAPLPDAVREALHGIPLILSYGMTEGASQITATPLDQTAPAGSVGLPLGGEIEARDPDGNRLGAGEVGALWIRGPGIVSSYLFGRASERFDEAGWLSTGDVGSVDEAGFVFLVGRSDDVINRGGEKVYPAEVEEVLLRDERVLEAVVVARPHDVLGQVPCAYVITAADHPVDATELIDSLVALCARDLPRFKRPVQIMVVPDLPRAPTGKVQRSKVRDLPTTAGVSQS